MKNKHEDVIIAFNEGAEIQFKDGDYWVRTLAPGFFEEMEYRIKPGDPYLKKSSYCTVDDINEILDCFDFEKVKKVMDFLNWEWARCDGVPEIYELRKFARQMLNDVVADIIKSTENTYCLECGGFRAEANVYDDDEKIYLRLSFNLESWDNLE